MGAKLDRKIQEEKFKNWFENIAISTLFVLHNKEGFGNKRLSRFFENWYILWRDINNDYLTCADMRNVLKNKCNIDIKRMLGR